MPYDLFWFGPIQAFDYYLKKEQLISKTADRDAWMQGIYFAKAIAATMSKQKYPDHPILFEAVEKAQREQDKTPEEKAVDIYNRLKRWSDGISKKFQQKERPSE